MSKNNDKRPFWLEKYAEECFPTPLVNFGGAVKRTQALRLCVIQTWHLQKGSIDDLVFHFQKLLGLTERRIREDYVKDLFKFRIIERLGNSSWQYIGKDSGDSTELISESEKTEKYVCAQCGKDITEQVNSEQEYFQFHGLKFCKKKCYDKYLEKLEKEDLSHG